MVTFMFCISVLRFPGSFPVKKMRNSCDIVKKKTSLYLWSATSMHTIVNGLALTLTIDGMLWWNS
jgi:hypothetical protein